MPPKILFILHLPPPVHGAAMVGKYIHDSELINNKFDCRYINLSTSQNLQEIGKVGVKKLIVYFQLLLHIYRTVKMEKPDLCYVTPSAYRLGFYKEFPTIMLLKLMDRKIVVHYHNQGISKWSKKLPHKLFCKIFFRKIKVILLAKALYRDIEDYVKPKNVYICPNGISSETGTDLIETEFDEQTFHLLFLSNMMKAKGVWDLLDACTIMKEKGMDFTCDFLGKWSDIQEGEFATKVREKNLENHVQAYGAKYNEEKDKFFKGADCFILPTHNECFPLVLLEAMQHGMPCISTNEGGISEIIEHGKTGFIVGKHNPQELAERITELAQDRNKCRMMGKAGKEKYKEEFTIQRFEKRFTEILTCIIHQ